MFDTVALSEARKRRPNAGFAAWVQSVAIGQVHTSVLCLGEVRKGVEGLFGGAPILSSQLEEAPGFGRGFAREVHEVGQTSREALRMPREPRASR